MCLSWRSSTWTHVRQTWNIMHEKAVGTMVAALLTVDHKLERMNSSKCLAMFQSNPKRFLCRFITVDDMDSSLYSWDQTVKTVGRSGLECAAENKWFRWMAIVFSFLCYSIYLEKGKTITGELYVELLGRLDVEIKWGEAPVSEEISALSSGQ